MEKDDEVSGEANSYTSYFRQFDPRTGRAFSLDPVQRAGQTMYGMMSNNPIVMIDPRGDDDYYNERGVYLYSDTRNSNDIRLITQKQFNAIHQNYSSQIADKNSSYRDLIEKLDTESRVITIKVNADQFKSMIEDSNLKSNDFSSTGENRRMEQAGLLVLDVDKAEIRLERQDDSKNTYDTSFLYDGMKSPKDNKSIWQPTDKPFGVESVVVIGTVHTHALNFQGEFGTSTFVNFHDRGGNDDGQGASDWNVPFFQIYPERINQIDVVMPGAQINNIDNIDTTKNLFNGLFNLAKKALELNGGKPQEKDEKDEKNGG